MKKHNFKALYKLSLEVYTLLREEPLFQRPKNMADVSGGLLYLHKDIPTILVPDLHNRHQLLSKLLGMRFSEGVKVQEALLADEVQVVLVGDLIHTEDASIWWKAQEEYEKGFQSSKAMDFEMQESLKTIQLVLELKKQFPENFHILRGNHENILSLSKGGSRVLVKYAKESKMVKSWLALNGGEDWMQIYSKLENQLPLLAVGSQFLVSHAQPKTIFSKKEVIEGLGVDSVVHGLTWTRAKDATQGSITAMKEEYLGSAQGFWFAGHTTVHSDYVIQDEGLVLFHNPEKLQILKIEPDQTVNFDQALIQFPF